MFYWGWWLLYLVGAAIFGFVSRRWYVYARSAGRRRSLQQQIDLNPANATARAQLAEIWLDRGRPRRAIPLLEQALERDPKSGELHYLLGVAKLRAGDAEGAIEPLSTALAREEKLRYGAAYLAIADAAAKVGRSDDAVEAYKRYVKINTSSIEGYCKLSALYERMKDMDASKRARREALDTYRALPGYQRRKQFVWMVRAKLGI